MNHHQATPRNAYAAAGVDTAAGDRAAELMKAAVQASHNDSVLPGSSGFAGMVDASAVAQMRRPALVTSTDGVGTKVAIAQALGVHDTIGQDLVAMVVDDITVVGARPLFMTDYIACGRVIPEMIAQVVGGIARACAEVDCPLIGGETAEHPGMLEAGEYDLAGACTGVVEADQVLGAPRVQAGDVLVALAASGLHSNGFSLVRKVFRDAGWAWERHIPEAGTSLGHLVLEPTALYSRLCLQLVERFGVGDAGAAGAAGGIHAFSHITGGGLAANLARVLPAHLVARVDRGSWQVPFVFDLVRRVGKVDWVSLEDTLNLGVGMVAVVSEDIAEAVIVAARAAGVEAWPIGAVSAAAEVEAEVPAEVPAAGGGPVDAAVADQVQAGGDAGASRLISGTKGVQGGAVELHGTYRV